MQFKPHLLQMGVTRTLYSILFLELLSSKFDMLRLNRHLFLPHYLKQTTFLLFSLFHVMKMFFFVAQCNDMQTKQAKQLAML